MNKLKYIITVLVICLSLCACGKEEEKVEPIATPTPEPTLEEILGYSAKDLISTENNYSYQSITLSADLELIETVSNRPVLHVISNKVVHNSDEFKSYDIITSTDSHEDVFNEYSQLIYKDKKIGVMYFNDCYDGWYFTDLKDDDTYWYDSLDTTSMNETLFEQQGDYVYVEGEISNVGDTSIDKYIQYILSYYNITNYTYTFRGKYNSMMQELQLLQVNVNVSEEGEYEGNKASISEFSISVIPVSRNNEELVSIPNHIPKIAMEVEEFIEVDKEVKEHEDKVEFDKNQILCKSIFGCNKNKVNVKKLLRKYGYTEKVIKQKYKVSSKAVLKGIKKYITKYTYKELNALKKNKLKASEKVAIKIIKACLAKNKGNNNK